MSKRPKYHFLSIKNSANGKHLLTIEGQTFGRTPVTADIIVKDIKGSTIISRTRKKAAPEDVFFTTTLKEANGCYTVKDIYPLSESDENVLFSDARSEYDKLLRKIKKAP